MGPKGNGDISAKGTKGKWRYASSKGQKNMEIFKQQSEIEMRRLPAIDRFMRYGR